MSETAVGGLRRVRAAFLYVLAIVVIALVSGDPGDGAWWLPALGRMAWAVSPILIGLSAARLVRGAGARKGYFVALGLLALAGLALIVYSLFVGQPDAQSALVMLVVPLYQWIALVIVFAIAFVAGRAGGRG